MSPELGDLLTFLLEPGGGIMDADACKAAFRTFFQSQGIEYCNYGVFECAAGTPTIDMFTDTNMDPGWIEEYMERSFDQDDYVLLQAALLTPSAPFAAVRFGDWLVPGLADPHRRSARVLRGAADAGLADAFAMIGQSPLSPDDRVERFFAFAFGGDIGTAQRASERHRDLMIAAFALLDRLRPFHRRRADGIDQALSSRERDVLAAHADGLRRDMIAHKLGISLPTVDLHTANLRAKLKAQTVAEATARGYRYGFL